MTKNVAVQDKDAVSLLNHYRRLIRLRNAHSALNGGFLEIAATTDAGGTTAAWLRSSTSENVLVLVNFGARDVGPLSAAISASVGRSGEYRLEQLYEDPSAACSDARISADGKSVAVSALAAHGVCVLRVRRD